MYDRNIAIKALKQSFLENENFAYLLIKINRAEIYKKIHGEIAYEKVLKTLSAILNSTIPKEDFIGHISDNEMILITNPYMSEQFASFLAFAFDNILNKFYSDDEFNNNLTIKESDDIKESKTGLMRLNISSVEKAKGFEDYREIISDLTELIKALENNESSSYIIDRARLSGIVSANKKNKVLIFEWDEALSYLLKNVCEFEGIETRNAGNIEEFSKIYEEFCPDVVILDWGNKNESPVLNLAKKISKDKVKLIFSSSYLNKKEILKSGADMYLPKPYEIDDMLNSIKKFLL